MEAKPFSAQFTDKDSATSAARSVYLKVLVGSSVFISLAIFGIFSIYWGSLWKVPARNLHGWIVDFDGDQLGQAVAQGLQNVPPGVSKITWEIRGPSEFPNGLTDLSEAVSEEHCWAVVAINAGATANLNSAVSSVNASYDGAEAVTAFGDEARNENAFRLVVRPTIQASMDIIGRQFAHRFAGELAASSSNITALLTNAPQIVTEPLSYRLINLKPFDVPVATAAVFVGLIYLTILSFFIVMTGNAAREMSGLDRLLTYGSLIRLRIASVFIVYFFLSLFYSLLSMAFQLPFDRKFGNSGFLVFWMLNWFGMLSLGLALESMITLLTVRFIPFFLLIWIIGNVSVSLFPIDLLPGIFRYGYGAPFYNISRAMRTIVFGTKNNVGLNFGVLIVWIAISCITLPLFQWLQRRSAMKEYVKKQNVDAEKDVS
ncbi:hypothetical protein ONZ45_g404 [Pleurotus djamor]|nr:hypothetical protein ONZ45_g404 [Pleurotus djamor]